MSDRITHWLDGNGTALVTSVWAAARRFQSEVQVGMVGINVTSRWPHSTGPRPGVDLNFPGIG